MTGEDVSTNKGSLFPVLLRGEAILKQTMDLIIYTDGASRNNPGEAGAGVFILCEGKPFQKISRYLGTTTNNIAEYSAAIIGLEHAVEMGASRVKLYADSELLVKQLNGEYKVKNEGLKPLHRKIKELIARIGSVTVQYIPREMNKEADALANKAIDEKTKPKFQAPSSK